MSRLAGRARRGPSLVLVSCISLASFAAIGAAVVAGLALQPRPGAHAASGNLPPSLPSHFSFGIMDGPGDTPYLNSMRSTNGTAWDFRYQYFVGGVNTSSGWETWNAPAGAFATSYLQDSGNNGYLPGLVYYEMQQSNGSCNGCGEAQRDLSNLNNSSTMSAYYTNWTLLMREVGAYGKPALVIVEPDLWGFIEQVAGAHGNSASGIPASVASSGNADASGFPNTAQGFAWALLHIRDRYAHNAVLALHASAWGMGPDIASNTSASLDIGALATQQAQFLNTAGLLGNPSGVSTFDLLSNDVADHDSGQSGIWWDRNNVTFPNFARYLQYASGLSAGTGRRIMMWQVPAGNQYFDTEDNSQGHTQDNRAEYILGHIADFARAGIIGVLFGPGNGGTWPGDTRKDGVTNPAPISTYECDRCNSHTSTYSDDDGGYLRLFVGQYYRSGVYTLSGTLATPAPSATSPADATATPVPSATAPADATATPVGSQQSPTPAPTQGACTPTITFGDTSAAPSSATAGAPIAVTTTLTASCASQGLVDFEVYSTASEQVWQVWQDNQSLTGQAQTFQARWDVPASLPAGTYYLKIGVFSAGWGTLYGWNNTASTLKITQPVSTPVAIQNAPCTVTVSGAQRAGNCSGTFIPAGN